MDNLYRQSLGVAIEHAFADVLHHCHRRTKFWHYGVTLPSEDKNSLSSLVGLSLQELLITLEICGLYVRHKSSKEAKYVCKERDAWRDYLCSHNISNFYFDKMKVAECGQDGYVWWVGIGID